MASILKEVFSNRNIIAISTTNMLYQVFNSLWELWWSLYLMEELNTPVLVVGLLATIQNTSQILFQLPGGILADRIGRKKVIVLGTGLRTIAPLILYFAKSWHLVAVGLLLNSMSSLYGPAFNAIISESLPKERRGSAFGAYRMFTSLPQIFMPVLSGYYFDMLGLGKAVRYGLLMFFGAMIVVTVVRYIVLKETLDPEKSDAAEPMFSEDTFKTFRSQPRTIYAMLAVAVISSFAMRMTWTYLTPYAIQVIGLSKTQYGMLQSIAMAISVPLYLISGMVADRFGRVPCILLARGLGPFDSLSLYLFHSYEKLMVAYGVIGFAGGLGGGRLRGGGYMGGPAWQALIADIVPSKDRAKIMGLMGTISGVIGLPGAYLGGYMYDRNPDLLLLSGSILEAMSIPLILLFVREPKGTDPPAD
ncbi:MFS transporter [Candidatus Bathyarchaeota archaeon]|nr:MFS transporter [Candidatus Bathyarchaeota archaeon]